MNTTANNSGLAWTLVVAPAIAPADDSPTEPDELSGLDAANVELQQAADDATRIHMDVGSLSQAAQTERDKS